LAEVVLPDVGFRMTHHYARSIYIWHNNMRTM